MSSHVRLPGIGGCGVCGRSADSAQSRRDRTHDVILRHRRCRRAWCSTIGPETIAPVAEIAWLGTTTAIATSGWLAGAKAIIQSVVAVFPVTDLSRPGLRGDLPLTVGRCRRRCLLGAAGNDTLHQARDRLSGLGGGGPDPRGRLVVVDDIVLRIQDAAAMTWGFMITPSSAIADATIAISRGVACTSPWPIAEYARKGRSPSR